MCYLPSTDCWTMYHCNVTKISSRTFYLFVLFETTQQRHLQEASRKAILSFLFWKIICLIQILYYFIYNCLLWADNIITQNINYIMTSYWYCVNYFRTFNRIFFAFYRIVFPWTNDFYLWFLIKTNSLSLSLPLLHAPFISSF